MNKHDAQAILKLAINNPAAEFRPGQWEAIDGLVNHAQKMLVVERTGWGKSSVYFISTRILRDRGAGPSIIISPLLALMRNQVDAARRLGIHAITFNSTNQEQWEGLRQQVLQNRVDAILLSPEKLGNEEFVDEFLMPIANKIGLMVVDEVHCISDWGHDFRPDYRRILNIIQQMPPNMPVLGTTATANNRVVNDIKEQLGDIVIQRGPLIRETLYLQNIVLPDQAARLAWLSTYIPKLPGAGIVYVITKRDAQLVSNWLNSKGIVSAAYFSGVEHKDFADGNQYREFLEDQLLNNKIKVLVATIALGMGYDKPDLGFVINYQAPSSIVAYYQQVGRAGRGIAKACGILLSGKEDERIHEYFRTTAFPDERDVQQVLNVLANHDGLSLPQLQEQLNLRQGQIEKVLKYLNFETPSPVIKFESKWMRTPVQYSMDKERIYRLSQQRYEEWEQIQAYIQAKGCLMTFLRAALDDPAHEPCGKCANCRGRDILSPTVDHTAKVAAADFLRHSEMPFKSKIRIPGNALAMYGFRVNMPVQLRAEEGRILSRWGDAGWGEMVEQGKHGNHFDDALVEAVTEMIQQRWRPNPKPQWITCVPSLNHPRLVMDFALRLSKRLGLPFLPGISKKGQNEPQKMQQNTYHQCKNLDGMFALAESLPKGPVLLIDDVIDSGWTMSILAALLKQRGVSHVYPIALASTSTGD